MGIIATAETDPVLSKGDAADDPAIWVHPTQPSLSLIIGTDKQRAGLAVYSLDGRQIQFVKMAGANNVDLRDNFSIDEKRISLVVASNPAEDLLEVFRIDENTRRLSRIAAEKDPSDIETWGVCMYRSAKSGRYYVFNIARKGYVEQWEITDLAKGVRLKRVRNFPLSSKAEACVADDEIGALYVSEEEIGIWRFGAEPDSGSRGKLIDHTKPSGHLHADVEGLAIYYAGKKDGYIIASSQGNDRYVVYDRSENGYIGQFKITDGPAVDGTSKTDGIEITNRALGPNFPEGVFVAQDGDNRDVRGQKRQNFKLVRWEAIARNFEPGLKIVERSP